MNRKIYLDVGSYNGDTVWGFTETQLCDKDFEIFAFECDSGCVAMMNANIDNNQHGIMDKCKNVEVIPKAAWVEDGEMEYYPGGVGGSLRKDKTTMINPEISRKIECLDLIKWIKSNLDKDDQIYCKINIEGSEYPILEKMIDEDIIDWFDLLWVDFHAGKLKNLEQSYEDDLKKRITDIMGMKFMTQQKAEAMGIQLYVRF